MLRRAQRQWWSVLLTVALTTVAAAPRTLCARCHGCVSHTPPHGGGVASVGAYLHADWDASHPRCPLDRHCQTSRFSMALGDTFTRSYEETTCPSPLSAGDFREKAMRGGASCPGVFPKVYPPSALAMRTRLGSLLC